MIAGYHAQALSQIPGTRLVGVCGRDPARTEAFAAAVPSGCTVWEIVLPPSPLVVPATASVPFTFAIDVIDDV